MNIDKVIKKIKHYYLGEANGIKIDESKTRDKILFGDVHQVCTGIVVTCWPTIDVIKKTISTKANLIICHEALFWNHGDQTSWLEDSHNETFLAKIELLKKHNLVVWRNHDYIHTGIPLEDGTYKDGIFYGLAQKLGWVNYIKDNKNIRVNDFKIPPIKVCDLSNFLIQKLGLNGIRIVGNKDALVSNITIPFHILGDAKDYIVRADKGEIDCFIAMEIVDFTLNEYIIDRAMQFKDKAIIAMGHFNVEEPGMEYMLEYLPTILDNHIPCSFIKSGDNNQYLLCTHHLE